MSIKAFFAPYFARPDGDDEEDKMEKKHTPLPWAVTSSNGDIHSQARNRNHWICQGPNPSPSAPPPDEISANATFIVHAVNCHDELVAQLQKMTEHYVSLAGCGDCGSWNPEEETEVIEARATIAKALATPATMCNNTDGDAVTEKDLPF